MINASTTVSTRGSCLLWQEGNISGFRTCQIFFTLVSSSLVLLPKYNTLHIPHLWKGDPILRNFIHWMYNAIVQSTGLGLTFLHQVWPAEKDSIFKGRVGLLGEWTQIWQWADNRWLNSIDQCNYALDKWDNAFLLGFFSAQVWLMNITGYCFRNTLEKNLPAIINIPAVPGIKYSLAESF